MQERKAEDKNYRHSGSKVGERGIKEAHRGYGPIAILKYGRAQVGSF